MRIAIIGSGISGLVAAHRLNADHDLTIFEANSYPGGHTHTIDVEWRGERHHIDTGFIVFNDRTYPNFCRLLDELGVESDPTSMSFSVRCDQSGLEYNGTSLNGLFAQRRNLVRPRFYRMVRDILRFNRECRDVLDSGDERVTVGEYLSRGRFGREFAKHYLLPMGSAIWSCPKSTFENFPIRFVVEFYLHHGLLQIRDRPVWRVIRGGSHRYVRKLTAGLGRRLRLNSPVQSVTRTTAGVIVRQRGGIDHHFDEIILACHSDQALRLLGADATSTEREILSAIPYEPNEAILHTDESVLPRARRAWASWNYHLPAGETDRATVTYNMNMLQHLDSRHVYCVTLNSAREIDERKVIGRYHYSHPLFSLGRRAAQQRHGELIRSRRTSFCGAYWGNGFHEDGVNSALAVCRRFERSATDPSPFKESVHA
jgi:uncharacterized protein